MARRVNENFLKNYDRVILTQPLAHDKYIKQIYTKTAKGWVLKYESDSIHHVCPFDGVFRNCADCGALEEDFDVEFCKNKQQIFTIGAVYARVSDCMKAELPVDFVNLED